jgi:hypothetical protein
MRSFENRPDTSVIDEPFYAYYLNRTGIEHPGSDAVIASQATDWQEVARQVTQDPLTTEINYQKHMTHHMLDEVDLHWTTALKHCFLIRDPLHVVSSYSKKRDSVTAEDIGIERQRRLYEEISQITGQNIPIIDSKDVLLDPESAMSKLCEVLSIPFMEHMLHWPAGRRDSDGVWASHWYESVEASTGFVPYKEPSIKVSDELMAIAEAAKPHYLALHDRRLRWN